MLPQHLDILSREQSADRCWHTGEQPIFDRYPSCTYTDFQYNNIIDCCTYLLFISHFSNLWTTWCPCWTTLHQTLFVASSQMNLKKRVLLTLVLFFTSCAATVCLRVSESAERDSQIVWSILSSAKGKYKYLLFINFHIRYMYLMKVH